MSDYERKECGCSPNSDKCVHFEDDGSSLQIVHFPEDVRRQAKDTIGIDVPIYCIQFAANETAGTICTGDDFDDESAAYERFDELVKACREHPDQRQFLGAFVFEVRMGDETEEKTL